LSTNKKYDTLRIEHGAKIYQSDAMPAYRRQALNGLSFAIKLNSTEENIYPQDEY
jgi:hypothetical protein